MHAITDSDHKMLNIKSKKNWYIVKDIEYNKYMGPRYNLKGMDDNKWKKFFDHVENSIKKSTIAQRVNTFAVNYCDANFFFIFSLLYFCIILLLYF
jgi:ferritin-like protein